MGKPRRRQVRKVYAPPMAQPRGAAAVAPALGEAARLRVAAASGYQAAKRELASMRNWTARPQHADADSLPNLADIRARSRDLMMNAPIAAGAINTVVTNVVGTGLRFTAQASGIDLADLAGITPEQVSTFERAAEREWRLFQRAENCDSARLTGFAGMQELAFRSVLGSGDCFAMVTQARPGSPFDFALQLVEADRVSNPNFKADTETIAGGVEYDDAGAPVAYHVSEIPRIVGAARNWRRVPAFGPDGSTRMLHLVHRNRIAQSRGVPYLAPVMGALKHLDRGTEAELTAMVLNACIAIIGESTTGDSPLKAEAAAAGSGSSSSPGFSRANIDFEPGLVLEGFMPGESVKSFDASRPNAGFDPFVQAILRQVGVALELPFELLIKHFTASYSAARAALLQAWGFFRMRRAWLAGAFCQPVYELVIANAVMKGRIAAPGLLADPAIRAAWCGARWTGPSPGQLDPLKEVNAAEKRLALRLSTRTRETAELTGDDWEQVIAEFGEELNLMDELDVPESDEPPAPPPQLGHNGGPPMRDQSEEPDAVDPADLPDLEAA
jgi:lambda family phage portal protein